MKTNTVKKPVAKIGVNESGAPFGEISGRLELVDQVRDKLRVITAVFSCTIIMQQGVVTDEGNYVFRFTVIPRPNHRLGENPEQALLRAMFSDQRNGMLGSLLHFQS